LNVLEILLNDAQPGYLPQVEEIVGRLLTQFSDAPFEDVEKADFVAHAVGLVSARAFPADVRLQLISDLSSLAWWCGIEISDEGAAGMAALARRTYYEAAKAINGRSGAADPDARRVHTVFTGQFVNTLHSPTRGAFDYVRALAADPEVRHVDVFHTGDFTPEIQAYGAERLGDLSGKARFYSMDRDPNFLLKAVGEGPRTFHIWCEQAFAVHISLLALFGPTVMFTCGDSAPIQFADAYWYCHEPEYIQALWRRRGVPESFIANYQALESAPFNKPQPARKRTRADLGFGPDEIIVATAGNRLGVDFDQTFVDGMASLVLANPNCRWLVVGALQDFWIGAFTQVLGDQFTHVPFDPDLASLFALTDIFANPFRAGGGNTAIMAIDAGAVVLTRDDLGDVGAFVPAGHRASGAERYFGQLTALIADPALLAARRAEQQALLARRLDQELFAKQLKALSATAYERYAARLPADLKAIYAQGAPKRPALNPRAARSAR
jgi:hypothetical protein